MIAPARPGIVKICGMRDVASATVAANAGADLLGFVLAETRRQVAPELISDVREHLESLGDERPMLVAVTVNLTAEELQQLVQRGQVDMVQLSGDESPDLLDYIDIPVIKTVHVEQGMDVDDLRRTTERWFDRPRPVRALLVDAKVAGHYGGTGARADWALAALLAQEYPVMLAGGLMPGNVGEGISTVHPLGVDVSSGVEIGGVKDHALIESFVVRARQAYSSLQP